jgi:antirestriction protein
VDGFQALAALDSDHNGVIDARDTSFKELQVWQDANQDGVSQADELHSLSDLSIKSISLGFTPVSQDDAGNWIGIESSYQTTDEETHKLVDVWFKLG